jgi:hypothetical protein
VRARSGLLLRLGALSGVALLVRGYALGEIPINLAGDEGTWGLNGLDMLEGRLANPFATRWFDFPSMSFLPWGLAAKLLGGTVAALRLPSVLVGAATVPALFALVYELWDERRAWLAAAFLTFGHYHMHYSRLAINNIADGLFFCLFFWLLLRAVRTETRSLFVLAGGVLGFSWYGYTGARLILVVMAIYLGWQSLDDRGLLRRHWRDLFVMIAAAAVVAAPLLLYYLANPYTFDSRFNQVSIFASGWLEMEQIITGRSALSLMLQQVWKSVSAFHYTVDPTYWYRPGIPLLDFVSGVLILPGVAWAVYRWRERGSKLALLWFGLAVTFGWIITENPPSSQRLVIAGPVLAILVGTGCNWMLQFGERVLGGPRSRWSLVAAATVGVVALVNLEFYFIEYTPSRIFGNPTAEVSDVLVDHLRERGEVPPVHFDGAPFLFWDFGAIRYRTLDIEGMDIYPEQGFVEIDLTDGALIAIESHKIADLPIVQEWYPGGALQEFYSEADGRLLFVIYEIPARRQ